MPSADFAAAQVRLAARRQRLEEQRSARQQEQQAAHEISNRRLPLPLRSISDAGLSVWDTIKGREGTRPAFRVGQVDAELLDDELLDLLKGQVSDALKYFGAHLQTDWSPEILLALRAILFKLTIWDHNATYGASLQGLRYTNARDTSLSRPPPKSWQKSIHGLLTVFGRYGWTKWEDYLIDQEGGYEAPPPTVRKLSRLTSSVSTIHSVAALASFLTFLLNGQYRTLLDRILRLRLVPASIHTSREVSFEYLNRQLVWHAFTEFLLFLLPLVGVSKWRRIANRSWKQVVRFCQRLFGQKLDPEEEDFKKSGELGFLPERTCAICYSDLNPAVGAGNENDALGASAGGGVVGSAQTDITNPYEAMPCGDVYCFVCITQRIEAEEGEGWTCLRCGEVVRECQPWNGDVLEAQPTKRSSNNNNRSAKAVGFFDPNDRDAIALTGEGSQPRTPLTPARSDATMKELEPIPTEDELERIDEEVEQFLPPDVLRHDDVEHDEDVSQDLDADVDVAEESNAWAQTSDVQDETDDYSDEEMTEDEEGYGASSTAWPQ